MSFVLLRYFKNKDQLRTGIYNFVKGNQDTTRDKSLIECGVLMASCLYFPERHLKRGSPTNK